MPRRDDEVLQFRGIRPRSSVAGPTGLLALLFLALSIAASALDWPIEPAVLAATFGTPGKGGPILGTVLAAEGGLVRTAGEGELLYARESYDPRSLLPSTLGSFAIVEQAGDMAALYGQLAPGSVPGYLRRLRAREVLGAVGNSGYAEGRGLLFALFDRQAERWLNPLLLLPPIPETKPPQVRKAILQGEGRSHVLGESRALSQGSYSLALELVDPPGASWSAGDPAPFYLRVLVDGAKLAELRWELAGTKAGRFDLFPAEKDGPSLSAPEGRILLPPRFFARGSSIIELLLRDFAGNERQVSWTVKVE